MIRKLNDDDIGLYVEHVKRIYETKGWLSIKDESWINLGKTTELECDYLPKLFKEPWFHVWAKFDSNGSIIQSIRAHHLAYVPRALIVNYRSELDGMFNPSRDMLPILDEVMKYFESLEVYTFHVVRKVGFFEWRKNKFFEDIPPLNRYNCFFDEIIPANTVSAYSGHRYLAMNDIFPIDTGIVTMSLKQEFRKYNGQSIIPDTREAYNKIKNRKNFCIIGHNPDSQKISNTLVSNLIDQNVVTVGRDNFNFSNPEWQELLLDQISKIATPLTIIVNLFDSSKITLQQQIFDTLWEKYKSNPDIHIVVIGSTAHYLDSFDYVSEEYFHAKKTLNQTCFYRGIRTYFKCKLLLVEPGTVECYLNNSPPSWSSMYLTTDEFVKKLLSLIEINSNFLAATLNGPHVYLPSSEK